MRSLARRAPRCAPRRGDRASRPAQRSKLQTHSASESARLQSRVLACSHVRKNTDHLASGDRSPRRRRARTHRQHRDGRHEPRWARGAPAGGEGSEPPAASADAETRALPLPRLPSLPPSSPREAPRGGEETRDPFVDDAHSPPSPRPRIAARARRAARRRPHLRGLCPSASFSGRLAFEKRPSEVREKRVRRGEGERENAARRRRRLRRTRTRFLSCSREGGCTASRRRENVARTPIVRYPRRLRAPGGRPRGPRRVCPLTLTGAAAHRRGARRGFASDRRKDREARLICRLPSRVSVRYCEDPPKTTRTTRTRTRTPNRRRTRTREDDDFSSARPSAGVARRKKPEAPRMLAGIRTPVKGPHAARQRERHCGGDHGHGGRRVGGALAAASDAVHRRVGGGDSRGRIDLLRSPRFSPRR